MSDIDNIVTVNITSTASSVTRAGFGTLLVASEFLETETSPSFTERIRFYSTAAAMATDGFATTGPEYRAAVSYFSQTLKPPTIAIGRKLTGIDGTETWTEALNAIMIENPDFYGVAITSRTQADQELAVAWAETNKKLAGFGTDDAVALTVAITDLMGVIQAASRKRSFVIYDPLSDGSITDNWPECAWFGYEFPLDPGQSVWKFDTLSGVTVYTLTETEITNVLAKNGNIYTRIGGVNMTQKGKVGSGEWIDVIRDTDALTAHIQEDAFALLTGTEKIPYTDPGAASMQSTLKKSLQDYVDNGVLSADPAPTTTVPAVIDVPTADKVSRLLPNLNFVATLAGAIQSTVINGTLSV